MRVKDSGRPEDIKPIPPGSVWTSRVTSRPICLPCHRRHFGMDVVLPPPPKDFSSRMVECAFCGRSTNQGLYLEGNE